MKVLFPIGMFFVGCTAYHLLLKVIARPAGEFILRTPVSHVQYGLIAAGSMLVAGAVIAEVMFRLKYGRRAPDIESDRNALGLILVAMLLTPIFFFMTEFAFYDACSLQLNIGPPIMATSALLVLVGAYVSFRAKCRRFIIALLLAIVLEVVLVPAFTCAL